MQRDVIWRAVRMCNHVLKEPQTSPGLMFLPTKCFVYHQQLWLFVNSISKSTFCHIPSLLIQRQKRLDVRCFHQTQRNWTDDVVRQSREVPSGVAVRVERRVAHPNFHPAWNQASPAISSTLWGNPMSWDEKTNVFMDVGDEAKLTTVIC